MRRGQLNTEFSSSETDLSDPHPGASWPPSRQQDGPSPVGEPDGRPAMKNASKGPRGTKAGCLLRRSEPSNLDSPLSEHPHDLRSPDQRVLVHMLVPVDEQPWLRPLDVAVERLKADVSRRVPLVHVPG